MIKKILILLLVALIAIQFVPVNRANPEATGEIEAPAPVMEILRRSCFDCHSAETHWPWYSYVAPFSWLVEHDVEEGREELNFSNWKDLKEKKRAHKLEEVEELVREGEMPLPYYLWMHSGANLSDDEKATLEAWATGK